MPFSGSIMNLQPYIEDIEKQKLKVEGLIVFQRGRELARHRWVPESPRHVFSVSKSFSSVAVGMAIDEGLLRLSDGVARVLGRKGSDPRWDALTLEHLLTMNMGHTEPSRPQSVELALGLVLDKEPGATYFYDSTCTLLASAMLTKVTGLKLRDYLLDRLFRPLGIPDPLWEESDDGYSMGGVGLHITTSDMLAFGRFLLQRGNWEGKQLVSTAWLDAATRTQVATMPSQNSPDYNIGYGYQFWTCRHGAFRCDGKNGQFIVVIPSLDAVIAINSDDENMKPVLWAVWDNILPQLTR
jgi:CubicO group peptidase (beta-lactamase class C family)